MIEFEALNLSRVREWSGGFTLEPGILETLAHWVGFDELLVSLSFLSPTFREVRGCVLLPWAYEEATFDEWWSVLEGDRRRIESMVNHLHLWDVFPHDSADSDGLVALGRALELHWAAAAQFQFPDRQFDVDFSEIGDDGPTVSIVSG